jgi:hypothetical protein
MCYYLNHEWGPLVGARPTSHIGMARSTTPNGRGGAPYDYPPYSLAR